MFSCSRSLELRGLVSQIHYTENKMNQKKPQNKISADPEVNNFEKKAAPVIWDVFFFDFLAPNRNKLIY